jgi:hypothetical protein
VARQDRTKVCEMLGDTQVNVCAPSPSTIDNRIRRVFGRATVQEKVHVGDWRESRRGQSRRPGPSIPSNVCRRRVSWRRAFLMARPSSHRPAPCRASQGWSHVRAA